MAIRTKKLAGGSYVGEQFVVIANSADTKLAESGDVSGFTLPDLYVVLK